jgi:hypothetical protein
MIGLRNSVLGALALAILAGCGAIGPNPTPVPTPLKRIVKINQSKVPDGVVAYGTVRGTPAYGASVEDALELRKAGDVKLLTGAPDDFKEFVRSTIKAETQQVKKYLRNRHKTVESADCDFAVEIRVWGVGPAVATGRERGCERDSADVIWAKKDGVWRRVARMQGGWDCAVLERYRVPADITASTCWYDEVKTRAYNGPGHQPHPMHATRGPAGERDPS